MEEDFDITSANAEIILTVETLYPSGIKLQGFGVDSAVSGDNVDMVETRKGIDGKMVAGVIKNVVPLNITLEANSPSADALFTVRDAQDANNHPYRCDITIYLPATDKTILYKKGVLINCPSMPAVARTLQPTQWGFNFESVR